MKLGGAITSITVIKRNILVALTMANLSSLIFLMMALTILMKN